MGSKVGAQKRVAKTIGVTYDYYLAKVASGMKWCFACGRWRKVKCFGSDASRGDGLSMRCSTCEDLRSASRAKERAEYAKNNRERLTTSHAKWVAANPQRAKEIDARSLARRAADGRLAAAHSRRYAKNRDKILARVRAYKLRRYPQYVVDRLRRRAEQRGLPFDLTPEDIVIPTHCPVLGMPLVIGGRGQRDDCPSVDRIVPELGYVRGNICIISMKANRIKNDATIAELAKVLRYMRRAT